jgi:predicted  nucleic acid-binding Zn ribbon protein
MYTFEYRFYPKQFDKDFIEGYEDDMWWFISSLCKSGLALESCQNTIKFDKYYAYRIIAPEKGCLNDGNYNKYNVSFLKDLVEKSTKLPELEYIGENCDVIDCCTCENPSHYILFIENNSEEMPIICGDCMAPVPLYKFPKTYDDTEYFDILNWQKTYKACDMQFMQGIGEKHGYRMMNDPDSQLSTEGLRICSFLEEKTGKPFYYYLFRWYTNNKPLCPKCGEAWANKEPDKYNYDFVCHRCHLVSNNMR